MSDDQSTPTQHRFNRKANLTIAGAVCGLAIVIFVMSAIGRPSSESEVNAKDDVMFNLNLNNPPALDTEKPEAQASAE